MRILALLLVIVCLSGCGYVDEKGIVSTCTEKENQLLASIENGDLDAFKEYIQKGGDKNFRCGVPPSGRGIFPGERNLLTAVASSEDYAIVKYYLSLGVSDEKKQDLLGRFSMNDDDNLTRLLIENEAYPNLFCTSIDTLYFNRLIRLGYDINHTNKEYGLTVFLDMTTCPCPDGNEEETIGNLKYFIRNGANINAKDKNGKTAKELATNKKILKFLKTL